MVFKTVVSLSELSQKANFTRDITRKLFVKTSDFSIFFAIFLANSKGKDKLIALFQYLFEFLCACGKHSNIPEMMRAYQKFELPDMVIYYHLKESMSSARKVFRLFRFFDEIKGLTKILKTDKPLMYKVMSVFTYCCSIMYYVADNTLWLLSILVRSSLVGKSVQKSWKERKNYFSFFRIIAYINILLYSISLQLKENALHYSTLSTHANPFEEQTSKKSLLDGRRKIRFFVLELVLCAFRFFMLTKSLKLRGHQYIEPVFVGVCGLCSAILGFIKALFEKKIVLNLESQKGKQETQIVSLSKVNKRMSNIDVGDNLW